MISIWISLWNTHKHSCDIKSLLLLEKDSFIWKKNSNAMMNITNDTKRICWAIYRTITWAWAKLHQMEVLLCAMSCHIMQKLVKKAQRHYTELCSTHPQIRAMVFLWMINAWSGQQFNQYCSLAQAQICVSNWFWENVSPSFIRAGRSKKNYGDFLKRNRFKRMK